MTLRKVLIIVAGGLARSGRRSRLADRGKKVIVIDQEPEAFLGGQAYWSMLAG